ncbi:MAG TPA: histidine phosphatase family protein [Allosphingosinicella sp.]|nr:histidine phosphatase family protein [Allosphingosinicella sp.]
MKILTLLRHAKSGWDDPVARDFDRPLNKRGRRAAATVGRAMRDQGMEFDAVIASPAVRVVETLQDVGDGYGRPLAPANDADLYLASPAVLLDRIQHVDDTAQRLLVVGHNPGLEQLATLLTGSDRSGLLGELETKYPTATIAVIEFDVDRWADVAKGAGTLTRFIRPRDLDPELGPDD